MKDKIERVVNFIFDRIEDLAKIIVFFMVTVVTIQVVVRCFGGNIKWCEEIMLLLLDALMFLLLPIGIKDDLHIRIDIFAKKFPKTVRKVIVQFSNIVILGISICMIWYGKVLMDKTYSAFTITGIPRKYLYLITVISGILSLIVSVLKVFGMLNTKDTEDFIEGIVSLDNV